MSEPSKINLGYQGLPDPASVKKTTRFERVVGLLGFIVYAILALALPLRLLISFISPYTSVSLDLVPFLAIPACIEAFLVWRAVVAFRQLIRK